MNIFNVMELAFGKGQLKKWALETALLEALRETKKNQACYLKIKDISKLYCFKDEGEELTCTFGYQFRAPQSAITIHCVKKDGLLYLTEDSLAWGKEAVEEEAVKCLLEQKKMGNLYYQASLNDQEFKL